MLRVGLAILLILTVGRTCGQDYFILIQSDNRQAFYVRMGGQSYSSSQEGHLILAHLKDSVYEMTIGFSGSAAAEQNFSIPIRQKDLDFMIRRDQSEGGWSLYDAESGGTVKPVVVGNDKGSNAFKPFGVKKEDAFSQMMAGIVRDTAILYDSYAQSATSAADSGTAINKSTPVAADTAAVAAAVPGSAAGQRGQGALAGKDSAGARVTAQGAAVDSAVVQTTTPVSSTAVQAGSAALPVAGSTAPPAVGSTVKSALPADSAGRGRTDSVAVAAGRSGQSDSAGGLKSLMAQLDSAVAVKQAVPSADSAVSMAGQKVTKSDSGLARVDKPSTKIDSGAGLKSDSAAGIAVRPTVTNSGAGRTVLPADPAVSGKVNSTASADLPAGGSAKTADGSHALYRAPAAGAVDALASPSTLYRAPAKAADSSVRRTGAVAKLSEKKSTHSVRQVYTDRSAGKKADTIVVVIPVDSPAAAGHTEASAGAAPLYRPSSGPNAALAAGNTPGRQADTNKRGGRPALKVENSDCHSYATDYDVDKLRIKLLEATKEEDMLALARKSFKVKCFSTPQIRALSEVFSGDAAKFHFFEAAYPFCSDSNFHDLMGLLGDPVYANKFRAMTNQ